MKTPDPWTDDLEPRVATRDANKLHTMTLLPAALAALDKMAKAPDPIDLARAEEAVGKLHRALHRWTVAEYGLLRAKLRVEGTRKDQPRDYP